MNKSIKRVRRVGANLPAMITNTSLVRDVPKSATNALYNNTISQRIATLETEVADINVVMANNTTPLNNLSTTNLYVRNIQLVYSQTSTMSSGVVYYNTVDPSTINSVNNVTKLPIQINNLDTTDNILSEIVPINNGLCFMLPYDSNTYQLSFTSELKLNTENVPVVAPQSSINYLSGSPNGSSMPAIAKLVVYQVDSTGCIVDTNSSAIISSTWSNIITDPTLSGPAPANFKIFQEPTVSGVPGSYYKTGSSNISQSFNLLPVLDASGIPQGRRLITIAVTNGFCFSSCNVNITKLI